METYVALTRMVVPGDRIRDPEGKEWHITKVDDGLAWYSKQTNSIFDDYASPQVDSIFIARFNVNGKGVFTYNRYMTLVSDEAGVQSG